MNILKIFLFFGLSILLLGCSKKGCIDDLASNYNPDAKVDDGSCEYQDATLTLSFDHVINNESLNLDSVGYASGSGNTFSVEKLMYFISEVTILVENGENIIIDTPHYIDVSDAKSLQFNTNQKLTPGTYQGISFTFGLDSTKNINGYFPNAPESNMEWPDMMGGGYHHMKLEGKYDSLATGNIKNYATHIGKLEMMGMKHQNTFEVVFEEAFTILGETSVEMHINMNIDKWFESPNNYDFNNYDNGIMMNQNAQTLLNENGATDVFSLIKIQLN